MFIDVRIDGAGPFRLLVDTGSDGLFLNGDAAKAAGLKSKGDIMLYGSTASTRARMACVDRLESGGLTLNGMDAVFADSGGLLPFMSGIDGIAGMPVFRDVALIMDFQNHRVSAVRLGEQSYPPKAAVPYSGICPRVTIDVCGKAVPALLDTGSAFGLILPDLDSYPLVQPPVKDEGLGGFGLGSVAADRELNSQLAGVARLGPVTWTNPPLRQQLHGRPGNVGIGVLSMWKLAFDQHAHLIYFLGPGLDRGWPKAGVLEPRFRAGFLANLQGTGLRLVEVDTGGAFDLAGLRVGDVILTVDGTAAADFQSRGDWEAAKRRKLLVERKGSRFEATAAFAPDEVTK